MLSKQYVELLVGGAASSERVDDVLDGLETLDASDLLRSDGFAVLAADAETGRAATGT
jgi:hypothetical protein